MVQMATRAAAGDVDLIVGLGPNDLIPLDQAGLIRPASGHTIALVPLVLITTPGAANPPADLTALAAGTGPIGVPDKDSGFACRLVKKALLDKSVNCNADRLQPGGLDKLVARVAGGELPAAVVPATALLAHPAAVTATVVAPEPEFAVIALELLRAPHAEQLSGRLARTVPTLGEVLAGSLLTFVGDRKDGTAPGELFVYAGAGIREPLDTAAALFAAKTGIKVRYTYTGSACLLAQITLSQQGDLYIPGEEFFMEQAVQRGYVSEYERIAWFLPVIMTRKGNPKHIRTLADLAQPGLRVGIGEAKSCAIGSVTERLLQKNGLLSKVEPNVVLRTPMAPELGNAIKLASIDACINWDAVAAWFADSADVIPIPEDQNLSTPITAGVLKFAKQREAARQFVEYLAGESGQAVFEQARYTIDLSKPVFPVEPRP